MRNYLSIQILELFFIILYFEIWEILEDFELIVDNEQPHQRRYH